MYAITEKLLKHKIIVLLVFILASIICAILSPMVSVNYNMMDYLPDNSKSTIGLKVMNEEYSEDIPNLRVLISDITIPEALLYKEKLQNAKGVKEVNWLDDTVSINVPLETLPQNTIQTFYMDNNALFNVTVDPDNESEAISEVKKIIGDKGAMSGPAIVTVEAMDSTSKELSVIMAIAIPVILVILLLTTSSWIEPFLFLVTIGIAILLNSGTNIIFGEISFVTKASGSLLQLAVSMDYSIFLLHRFSEFREKGHDVQEAMVMAVKKSFSSITASGVTTVIGFAALITMRFKIGPDMGWAMAKGILFSLICVLVLLPVLALICYKLIDKTHHKPLMPKLNHFKKVVLKVKIPVLIIFIVVLVPVYLASQNNIFSYGSSEIYSDASSNMYKDQKRIEEIFGKSNQMVLLLPKGDLPNERKLCNDIKEIPEVTSIISYVDSVGETIPESFVPEDKLKKLNSENYTRMVLSLNMEYENEEAFKVVEEIQSLANKYYGEDYYLVGDSANTYDMKNVVTADNVRVNFIAILSVGIILILTFKSLTMPIILLLVIEASIWINLSIPYFASQNLFYIGYLIISSVQLGATIDYAILFGNRYNENRELYGRVDAMMETIKDTTISILTSASIMFTCGILLGFLSTNGILSQLGFLIGRGAALSAILVLFVLPAMITTLDKVIEKTSYNYKYYGNKSVKNISEQVKN